ncbi:lysine methyltransferase METTL21A [Seminavis robusta]|uniref:Lysine methyltransferase METTL21A n=1 Tax=Seminavis robusta TaxID=568900 RepID=A0A9N8HA54_9STRA|nr:lysine methyltransferase METTL21A [Seminavis robusta]|eukprot:Sro306_g113000.1 lysine methyltransferase METTL21A (283) ;mRNA; r:35602-36450
MESAAAAATPERQEEEWIESPDGWDDKKPTTDSPEEEEEGAFVDFFTNTTKKDPKDTFTFELTVHPSDDQEKEGVTKKLLQLSGYTLDSDETAQSTGVTLWDAAPRLANYLMKRESAQEHIVGRQVLELGAGLGLCGIVAFHLGASHVVLTDGDTQTLQQMRVNVQQNCHDSTTTTNNNATIDCRQLIWASSPTKLAALQESQGLFDTILGADIVYTKDSLDPMLDTVVALLKKPHGQFVLSRYTKWNNVSDQVVLEAAATRHLTCRQPPDSPGIFVFSMPE